MKIAITDLADYNNGILRYKWIDLEDIDYIEDLETQITQFLKEGHEEHEEYFISDYEGITLNTEYPDLNVLLDIQEAINEHGEEITKAYLDHVGLHYFTKEDLDNAYIGTYAHKGDYAKEITDLSNVPENLRYYIDFESMERDMELGGDISIIELHFDEYIIFSNR